MLGKIKGSLILIPRVIWRGVIRAQKIAGHLLFITLVIMLIVVLLTDGKPEIPDTTALVIAPEGRFVEQLTAKSYKEMLDDAMGHGIKETLLKDVLDAISAGKDDNRVKALVLDLSNFDGAHLTKLQDVRDAIIDFKSNGKKVIAKADSYNQDAYYLAAHADEIWMHEMGYVMIEGFGRYRMYYKEGIDKLGLDTHVFRVGEYKSYVEPFIRNDMSPEAREAIVELLGDLWRIYTEDVAEARRMKPAQFDQYAKEPHLLVAVANGDTAKAALDFGLADEALTRVEMREKLIELIGEDEETHSYNQVSFSDYLLTLDEDDRFGRNATGDKVAVVVARGTILDGDQPAGTIGGDSTAELIRQARNDDDVKAIVLRVDSGGGSAFASEVIRRECEKARAEGKPVIASMGSVAASGGFWISTSTDQIWAHESTITGSIGILGIISTYQRPLKELLGINVDGVSTAPLAGVRMDRELPEEISAIVQDIIEQGYRNFLDRVAESRGMTVDEVDEVARGRVWSGEDAHALGLVDNLGGLDQAIEAAAKLAKLDDDYTVSYVEKELEFKEQILRDLMVEITAMIGSENTKVSPFTALLHELERAVDDIAILNDPNHVYAWSNIDND